MNLVNKINELLINSLKYKLRRIRFYRQILTPLPSIMNSKLSYVVILLNQMSIRINNQKENQEVQSAQTSGIAC